MNLNFGQETLSECRREAEKLKANLKALELSTAATRAKTAADAAENQRLLELIAAHSDRTNRKGRE